MEAVLDTVIDETDRHECDEQSENDDGPDDNSDLSKEPWSPSVASKWGIEMMVKWVVGKCTMMLKIKTNFGKPVGLLLFALFGLVQRRSSNRRISFSDTIEYLGFHRQLRRSTAIQSTQINPALQEGMGSRNEMHHREGWLSYPER